ncbi:Phosphoesterase domain [Phytophthora cinnamomi]|uniref:Phosphoesterase domain n=1 Tax=Phytophthora cinnamomi TaxID=4785 RepID=UPI00355A8C23|nr:Phosphoesterase domain [Phytophthora cinnamomi]
MALERAHPDVALPAVVHRVAADVSASTRLLVIGDVHGCLDELQALLAACHFAPPRDRLVFVGDLVNKGPKSLDVVRFVRDSGSLCVRGNHDDAALAAYYTWVDGGRVPGSAKYPYVEQFESEDVEFLEQLPFSLSLPNHGDAVVVHAGLVAGVELQDQKPFDLYKMRFVQREKADDESSAWKALEKEKFGSESGGEPEMWAKVWSGPRHVYFGHAAGAGLQQESFATGLDTGCCYGRMLTACIIPSNTLVHVDAKEQYEVPKI